MTPINAKTFKGLPKPVQSVINKFKKDPILVATAYVERGRLLGDEKAGEYQPSMLLSENRTLKRQLKEAKAERDQKIQRLREANSAGESMTATVRNQTKLIDELKQELSDAQQDVDTFTIRANNLQLKLEDRDDTIRTLQQENARLRKDACKHADKLADKVWDTTVTWACIGLIVGGLATLTILQFV